MDTIVVCTRFNYTTWEENKRWRENKKYNGCIYCTPKNIAKSIPIGSILIVIEMQNSNNTILGIGIIKNLLKHKHFKIYSDLNYNRFSYFSPYRIDKKEFTPEEEILIKKIEIILFKGSGHLKRGDGITQVPQKHVCKLELISKLKKMFTNRFTNPL